MSLPEWLIERGIGETRAALVENGEIIEARIELDDLARAGSIIKARLANAGTNGRNAIAVGEGGTEYLLPRGAQGAAQGATIGIEITREMISGTEPWKRPLARATDKAPTLAAQQLLGARELVFPAPRDELTNLGWDELIGQARTGVLAFAGGELRISATPAMTLIDVDGYLAPDDLAVLGAGEAAKAIMRLDIGGSIGIDLPTPGSKSVRQAAAQAIDAALSLPFERTGINGFGFAQIVRPRSRASLIELAADRAPFEARALLRRAALEGPGAKRLVVHPAVTAVLELKPEWLQALSGQVGGLVSLRSVADLPMSGGYVEAA